ncbi:sulfatase-like hydrolase/transferase [Novipirellula artificiosorum]|nr:sulfatase-like hydrolase/transferase [Novipirellula artificiosorum]
MLRQLLALSLTICSINSLVADEQESDSPGKRPNILWLSCEDISPHLGCYGDKDAITPNIDGLAKQGVRYSNVFTTAGVCAPCRSAIITGIYQSTLGTHHMRCNAELPDFVKPFSTYMRQAGYYCTNNSKQDYQFKTPRDAWDESSGKAHWKNRQDETQPFFAVFNFTGCHESGIENEAKYKQVTKDLTSEQRQDPNQLTLPPYYPDTPVVREDWKRNYELITAMDLWAGERIQELKDQGVYEDTIIMYWSDHGVGLPRAKRWLYDSGTRIPLVVRIPDSFRLANQGQPTTVDDQLISSLDFAPTVLNLAGIRLPEYFQGRAFLGQDLTKPRDYVYGARDRMDERYDIIRAVRDNRFRYIRNYEPFKPYYQYMNTPEKGATMKELRRVHAEGELPEPAALFMANNKPAEELYDLQSDPHEIHNLAADETYKEVLDRMREVHLNWVVETRDIGLIPESEIQRREKTTSARYNILLNADPELIERIRNVANLAVGGTENFPKLVAALDDEDSVVRYWAAIGIGNLSNVASSAKPRLESAIQDEAPCVRIAAARALLKLQSPELALPVLQQELQSEHEWGRLRAAIVLGEAGEMARPLIPEMKACLKDQPNKYITRVANRTLNVLLGTDNVVN